MSELYSRMYTQHDVVVHRVNLEEFTLASQNGWEELFRTSCQHHKNQFTCHSRVDTVDLTVFFSCFTQGILKKGEGVAQGGKKKGTEIRGREGRATPTHSHSKQILYS